MLEFSIPEHSNIHFVIGINRFPAPICSMNLTVYTPKIMCQVFSSTLSLRNNTECFILICICYNLQKMDSESSFTCLLEDSFSDDETVDENVDYSSKIKDALENSSQTFDGKLLQQTLQECLSSCPDNSLDEKIFKETLPVGHRLLSEALEQIGELISTDKDAVDNIKRQLSISCELLILWEKSMERVSKLPKTSAVNLQFLLEDASATIELIFKHCRASTEFYGTLFEGVSEKLTNLFRKAKTILNLFLATLEGVIVFDTDTESETELLVKVIGRIGGLVSIANALDLKTFVVTSKMFGKLAITHQQVTKRVNPANIVLHLEQLSKDVTSMLFSLQNSLDNIDERKIKVIGHSLNILDKLLAAYCSSISNETLLCVVELLLQMHRYNPSCLRKKYQTSDKIIELINAHVARSIEPLLNTIFEHSNFKQVFLEYNDQKTFDKLSYHLHVISIMKKLVSTPYEQHCEWTLGAESIIDVALTSISDIQEEICTGDIKLLGGHDIGEKPRSATLYETTQVLICCLISRIPPDGFYAVELILLKHVFSDRLWSALLSADIWCFVARLGSSELCANHVKYLLKVYAALIQRRNSFEVVILENLIGRLYSLLSEETKHSIITEFDDLENPCWTAVACFLPPKTTSFLQKRLACVLNEIPEAFLELQRQPTMQNWNRITTLLHLIEKLNYTGEENTADILSQIWNCISSTIEIFEDRQLDIVSEFVWKLFNATQPENIQDDIFYTILEAMLTSLLCLPSHVKATASHYLKDNVKSFGDCGSKTANALAELNCQLLDDNNPWVRQEALESFDYVAHVCPNEDLVTKMATAVTRKPSLTDSLPAYLSGTCYYELLDFSDVRLYLQHVARRSETVRHACYQYEESQRDEKLARFDTDSSQSSVENQPSSGILDEQANKLCDELNDLLKKTADIGDNTLRRLRMACAKILDFTESSK
ncbi:FIGNL1-interacting regulator of recombination and mitosis isoform X2 [Lasioglossum baleicum]|uniref:FIGNL1-interacting regulator of recombination and mitosis isoform X2 n=1 Tax=Lasioglossum baleicum TaxID=434251 RepID=UPI003FCE9150